MDWMGGGGCLVGCGVFCCWCGLLGANAGAAAGGLVGRAVESGFISEH